MTPEKKAEKEVLLAASSLNCRLLRNNSGAVEVDGRFIRYGLGNTSKRVNDEIKSSDYIGITRVTITPEMVGKTVGVFTAIEVKPATFKMKPTYNKKSREHAQQKFHDFVRNFGGFAGFARDGKDLHHVIGHFINWLKS